MSHELTTEEIKEIQKKWGTGIVEIGKAYTTGVDYSTEAENFINKHYAYINDEKVLFKPTLASKRQFRLNFKAALSYFVGGNTKFPEDNGFAIKPYVKVEWQSVGIIIHGDTATSMGNYFFTDLEGSVTKVEYSFVHRKFEDGVKIILHHSSLPYVPPKDSDE